MSGPITITRAEVEGVVVDVRIEGEQIVAIGPDLAGPGDRVIDAAGGALIPGLHDHHLHLLAMAANRRSVDLADVPDAPGFDAAVQAAAARGDDAWLRVVGWDERHGPLDRARLDRLAPNRRVRVQHRSGAAWMLGSAGANDIGIDDDGWLHRSDAELRDRWAEDTPPDLGAIGTRLASLGVTGVTDATPFVDLGGAELLAAARATGALPQQVVVMGGPEVARAPMPAGLDRGPVKVVVSDHELPAVADLVAAFRLARHAGRVVAVHCVTRVGLVLALAAWEEVGAVYGDRIEHASVVPVELLAPIAELALQVVTQPAFVWARGDRYLAEVEPDDRPHLYRCASLLEAGIGVAGSTDAPFGPDDPWLSMRAAIERRTSTGTPIGTAEAIPPSRALDSFLGRPDAPPGPPRRVTVGAPADLCLLDAPLDDVLGGPSADHVRATWIGGHRVHGEG